MSIQCYLGSNRLLRQKRNTIAIRFKQSPMPHQVTIELSHRFNKWIVSIYTLNRGKKLMNTHRTFKESNPGRLKDSKPMEMSGYRSESLSRTKVGKRVRLIDFSSVSDIRVDRCSRMSIEACRRTDCGKYFGNKYVTQTTRMAKASHSKVGKGRL